MQRFGLLALTVAVAAGCATGTPAVQGPSPSSSTPPSVAPSAEASVAPGASPSAGSSASPAPVTSSTPAPPAFAWKDGKELSAYDFKGTAGVYYDFAANGLYVVDGVDDDQTPRRYLVREFRRDGTFLGAFHLNPPNMDDPDSVSGMAFDRRGLPFYTYSDTEGFQKAAANSGQAFWGVYELVTATVLAPTNLSFHTLPRAGVSTLAADGDTFTLGTLGLDPDKNVTGNRRITYNRCEEDQQPQAIFSFEDPFNPTVLMAASPSGTLYFGGPTAQNTFLIKQVDANNQTPKDFLTLDRLPSNMWVASTGELYMVYNDTSKAAVIRKYKADGTKVGETSLSLPDGGYLLTVSGLTTDPDGVRIVAATGVDKDNKPIKGLFTFTE